MAAPDTALALDGGQVKKAAQALLAYNKTKQKKAEKRLLNEDLSVFLMVTVWKIPQREQLVKIPLPHGILPETSEVCLFSKDEPGLTAEQTENLYRKLLSQNGVTSVTEVISYKTLKKEYKPFEAKRRLLGRFSLFLSDDRIRRLLPSHIGKHFYKSKKVPLSVNMKAKNLAWEINKLIQGTTLPITNKGCCYAARVGHTGMSAEEIAENIVAVWTVLAAKAPKISQSIKTLHLKTDKSIALPIFNSFHPGVKDVQKQTGAKQQKKNKEKKQNRQKQNKGLTPGKSTETVEGGDVPVPGSLEKEKEEKDEISDVVEPEDDEGIPLLVPIETAPGEPRDKAAELSPFARKEAEMDPKAHLLGKRKPSLSSKASVTGLETPTGGPSPKTPKRLKKEAKPPKQEVPEQELAKTPLKSKRKSVIPKREKAVVSAQKAPRTPKQAIGKKKLKRSV